MEKNLFRVSLLELPRKSYRLDMVQNVFGQGPCASAQFVYLQWLCRRCRLMLLQHVRCHSLTVERREYLAGREPCYLQVSFQFHCLLGGGSSDTDRPLTKTLASARLPANQDAGKTWRMGSKGGSHCCQKCRMRRDLAGESSSLPAALCRPD